MECNREEAIRAKEIAESKMKNKDYVGAHKFALKAQKLFPNLDNISQILAVCEVYCSAEKKIHGKEMDWYGILKVEQTADEQLIKKQFKKLALRLHPDKNNFAGAEAAFKLIGEAQQVLLDRGKRSLHDMKRRAFVKPTPNVPSRGPQPEASKKSNVVNQPTVRANPSSSSAYENKNTQGPKPHQQTQSRSSNDRPNFWTSCPFCGVKYQFFIETLEKSLICHSCSRPFIARDINSKVVQPETKESQPVVPENKMFPDRGTCKVAQESNFGNNTSNKKVHGNCNGEHSRKVDKEAGSFEFRRSKKNGKSKRKRKRVEEFMDDCETGRSSSTDNEYVFDEEDVNFEPKVFSGFNGEDTRKSARTKRQVSYEEKLNDNVEFASPRKKAKRSEMTCATNKESGGEMLKEVREDEKKVKEDKKDMMEDEHKKCFVVDDHSTSKSSSKKTRKQEMYEFPDPDFNDFDNIRKKGCFQIGQMWAIYDTNDAMPRFYALIKKVFPAGFKVRITWLEADPDDEDQINWVNSELPFSCGKFTTGVSQITEDLGTFSHIMEPGIGKNRGSYMIYPKKGETWAIFKNWGMEWLNNSNRKFDFDFVEILSDYIEGDGVFVGYLGKVKNFVSIFCRIIKEDVESFKIPHYELCRFSHKVPSFQMTGEEREDVPKGSFELDPASVPTNLEDEVKPMTGSNVGSSTYRTNKPEIHFDSINHNSDNVIKTDNDSSDKVELPESEFYDFAAEKSTEKLQAGQIWALYNDHDGLPNYYGKLKKIESYPNMKLLISWLLPIKEENMLRWVDKNMPICCGKFKISTSKPQYYSNTEAFSHQLRSENTDKSKGNEISIFPSIGEIWALYRNWNVKMKCSELENCEYDIGEVIEVNNLLIKVYLLERVNGFSSVFKRQLIAGFPVSRYIQRVEVLRFSHQMPAFQLKEERGGTLKGFWELDPASVPVLLYCSD